MAGVLVAIDWENIRRALPRFIEPVAPEQVCAAFAGVAARFGDYRGGTVFGDWTLRADDARVFESHGLQAYNVLRSRSGKDRSDPAINLEVYDWVRDRPDIETFILGSGDSDFQELIRRARNRGNRVVVCAFGDAIARELHTMTPVFPLEVELGLTLRRRPEALTPGTPDAEALSGVQTFISRMDELERTLPYVVLNYLKRTVSNRAWGVGDDENEKEDFFANLLADGVLEEYEIANPKRPGRMVMAVRLNRSSEIVKATLPGKEESPAPEDRRLTSIP